MNSEELKNFKEQIENLMYSTTKRDGQKYFKSLELKAQNLEGKIGIYEVNKLKETINYAKQASGQVSDKERWITATKQSWYVFEKQVKD